jgi:hypothetical protein
MLNISHERSAIRLAPPLPSVLPLWQIARSVLRIPVRRSLVLNNEAGWKLQKSIQMALQFVEVHEAIQPIANVVGI